MLIRREHSSDVDAIHRVHTEAFAAGCPDGKPVEPGLTDELRRSEAWIAKLALVADVDGSVIGRVRCTRAHLFPGERPVLGLGPIGVLPHVSAAVSAPRSCTP